MTASPARCVSARTIAALRSPRQALPSRRSPYRVPRLPGRSARRCIDLRDKPTSTGRAFSSGWCVSAAKAGQQFKIVAESFAEPETRIENQTLSGYPRCSTPTHPVCQKLAHLGEYVPCKPAALASYGDAPCICMRHTAALLSATASIRPSAPSARTSFNQMHASCQCCPDHQQCAGIDGNNGIQLQPGLPRLASHDRAPRRACTAGGTRTGGFAADVQDGGARFHHPLSRVIAQHRRETSGRPAEVEPAATV